MRTVDTDRLGDEIAELAAHLDAATHRLLTLIRQFDEAGGWADQGALSCAHWLSWRIGLELGAAREHVRVARALADLPLVDDALRRGQVSYSKVRALTRVATPDTEATLLEMARSSTASQLERICRGYRRAMRNWAGERPEDEAAHRWVRERETEGGLVRFEVQLRPDEAAVVRRALEAAMQRAWNATDVPAGTSPAVSAPRRCDRRGGRAVPGGRQHRGVSPGRGGRARRRGRARGVGHELDARRRNGARTGDDGPPALRCGGRRGRRRFPRERPRRRPAPAHDPDAAASSAAAAGSRLPLPGLHEPPCRRAPRRAVGSRRRDGAREPVLACRRHHTLCPRVWLPDGERRCGRFRFFRPTAAACGAGRARDVPPRPGARDPAWQRRPVRTATAPSPMRRRIRRASFRPPRSY